MAVAPDGAIYSRVQADTAYRIARFSAQGRAAGFIVRSGVPIVKLSADDRDSVESFRRGLLVRAETELARRSIQAGMDAVPVQTYKDLFAGMPLVDSRNRLLIARSSNMGMPVPIDVFDAPSGKFLGEARLRAGSKLVRATEQGILVFSDDEESGPSFSIYRLDRSSAASGGPLQALPQRSTR